MKTVQVAFPIPLDRQFTYLLEDSMECPRGARVEAPFGSTQRKGIACGVTDYQDADAMVAAGLDPGKLKTISKVLDQEALLGEVNFSLAAWIAETCFCSLGEALWTMVPQAKEERDYEIVLDEDDDTAPARLELSEEQAACVDRICTSPEGWFYLHGMTGSGKTEVYLQAASRTIQEGRSVLLLVPEIALSTQMVSHIEKRFSGLSAVLHSHLTPSQKLKQWRKIMSGEARFVVGARSAVFAPLKELGLIIVDEEHEAGYKSSSSPRYNARQVAMYRSRQQKARLVLGSATPSLEAWHQMDQGTLTRLVLSRRLAGGSPPRLKIIDMNGSGTSLSKELQDEILNTKAAGRQTILFLNRRGFSYFFQCKSCNHELTCKHCSVSLTYHRERNLLVCHYCGASQRPVQVCPSCGSLDLRAAGFGTEKIEEEIGLLFPDLRTARLDADTVKKKGMLESIIKDFRDGKTDLLLGTQMVAKGLNFPGLRLVGIINADVGLKMPDFRAMERTHSLITQVAGRAGRYLPDGLVLIQTCSPKNPGIAFPVSGDLEGFYRLELENRRMLGFPPFTRMIKLVFRSAKPDKALHDAKEFLLKGRRYFQNTCEVLGPAESAIFRVNSSFRYQILLVHPSMKVLSSCLRQVLGSWQASHQVHLEIDPDPVQLL